MASWKIRRLTTYLLTVKQREEEILKVYIYCFNKEHLATDNHKEKITQAALLGGIWPLSPFMAEITRRTRMTLCDFMDWANDFFNFEDNLQALNMPCTQKGHWDKGP